jgi:hypothetical protein
MKLDLIKISCAEQFNIFAINSSLSKKENEQIIRLIEKTMTLLILHDPVMGISEIEPQILGSRILQGMNDQKSDPLLNKAVNHLISMSDDHCKIENCFPDCRYWNGCPLAIVTNGPFRSC